MGNGIVTPPPFTIFSIDKLRLPPPFCFEGNVSQGWKNDFNDFVTELKKRGSECEFGDLTNSLTKDTIVCLS